MSKFFYNWHLKCYLSLTYASLGLGKVSLLNIKSVRKMIKNDINDAVSIKIIMTNIFYLSSILFPFYNVSRSVYILYLKAAILNNTPAPVFSI